MNCATALDQLLEADLASLTAGDHPALDRHLAECPRCTAVADRLRAEHAALDAGIGAWAEAADADAAVDAVLATPRPGTDAGTQRPRSTGRSGWRRAWVPLAAAAAFALLLLDGEPEPDTAGPLDAAPTHGKPTVAVRPPADRGAAIMATADPEITIVWLYPKEES